MNDLPDPWLTASHVGAYLKGMLPHSVLNDAIEYEQLVMQIQAVTGMDDDAVAAEVVRVQRDGSKAVSFGSWGETYTDRLTLLEAAQAVYERASRGEWP